VRILFIVAVQQFVQCSINLRHFFVKPHFQNFLELSDAGEWHAQTLHFFILYQ